MNRFPEIKVRTVYDRRTFVDGWIWSLADLRKYFTMFKGRGVVFGYLLDKNRTPTWQDKLISSVHVIIEYDDGTELKTVEFSNLRLMVDFLETFPEVADSLGYKKRQKSL